MNKKLLLITALLFLISISAVSAQDINQTDDNLDSSDSDILSTGEPKSYSNLLNDITTGSPSGLNIQSDYKFNNQTDGNFKKGIDLTVADDSTYTIEGNNHVIDANKQAGIFKFTNGTVYINNLKLINSDMSAIVLNNCALHTTNVTFENNYDSSEGSAIYASGSDYYSANDKFVNNYAKNGASIFGFRSIIDIDKSTFINNKEIDWGLIYAYNSITTVKNVVFANMTSKYATAIFCENNKLTVYNTAFINLFAKNTAGAIGLKNTSSVIIDHCSFINSSSSKNGGAVYADLNGGQYAPMNEVTVTYSLFENCSSQFGGAYLQLGGKTTIVDSGLISNVAEYNGGAIYLSNTTALIGNSKINNNKANLFYGGAVFIDDSESTVASCDIVNNAAGISGSGIYLYSSGYEIKNTYFAKNNGNVIASYFDRKGSYLKNNDLGGGKALLNQTEYTSVIDYAGKKIILNPTTVNETAKSSRFDLRDYNLTGVVKDQGSTGSCWAFAATGALESAFLKATGILLDLSENNVKNSALHYGTYGTDDNYEGGYSTSGMGLFLAWLGTLSVDYDSYDELGKITLTAIAEDSYHIQDAIIIPKRANSLDNDNLKEALIKYGGLTVHVYGAIANNDYYNKVTHAQYYNGKQPGNHFITLVGWDDNYSKDNFIIKPKGNGAWICKNSWGSDWGENGYYYISYYDTAFAMTSPSVGYIINNTESYERSYQYDIGDLGRYHQDKNGEEIYINNTYTAFNDELISSIGTYFNTANENYTITIYVDGKAVYSQSGASTHGGFETIKLDKKIAVNYGHEFSAEIKERSVPLLEDTRLHFENGRSFVYHSDNTIEDLASLGMTACIKVYTFTNENPEKTKNQYYAKNNKVKVKSNANGKKISIVKNNKVLGTATVKDGEAEFDLTLDSGAYSLITYYDEDDELVELFEIISTIEVDDSITVGYNAKTTIEVEFVDENGVELFDTNITYKLDGKNYTGTIEGNDGILYIDLVNLSIGNHVLVLENPESLEETTTTINVVSRFSGNSNVDMYYGDGSSFKVRVYGDDGNPVGANEIVTIKLNKVTYKVKTNANGYATLTIPDTVKPGNYALTATYAGQTIKNTVKVKQNLNLAKVTVKKSAEKLVIKATLKNGKTPIKYKKLTFKFNGKTYTAKTDKTGIAKITIKNSVLKKLKVGKNVQYQVTYLKNTVKQSVKVKK
ncbi:C1 family peptidase [Methanobrevibacter sp.]|uniref:C1 family peptidase n=1 Tax=Methanobrevibacter sp. TaxID=66852 RepID=UPI0025F57A22|nr:C1 family peptidase [Methanobrevibacter sp.]MBQ2831559.1 hypothetical protein [Methanobrevibacter sp.]